jgi:uncharacterized membrane protein YfcA
LLNWEGKFFLMPPLLFATTIFASSIVAGIFGSLLGVGGGIIVIPVLTLLLGVDIRLAIGASALGVIATSSGAAAGYVREHMTNLRVAMLLEVGTTAGALTGAFVGGFLNTRWLFLTFGLILAFSAIRMLQARSGGQGPVPPSPLADTLRLHGEYFDQADQRQITYRVGRPAVGLFFMYIAGMVSGLLGLGSGPLKVPALDLAMRLPIKVSTATSNFMMGVTAAASAGVYFARGDIQPLIAGPVAAGVMIGATVGSRWMSRLQGRVIRTLFVVLLLAVSVQMLLKGIHQ